MRSIVNQSQIWGTTGRH